MFSSISFANDGLSHLTIARHGTGPRLNQVLGRNLLGHQMFHPKHDLHSLFFTPASAVGLSWKPSAHASVDPVSSQGKQLSCFLHLHLYCGGSAAAVPFPAEQAVLWCCSHALLFRFWSNKLSLTDASQLHSPVLCPVVVIKFYVMAEFWAAVVFRSELLSRSLPRDSNRHHFWPKNRQLMLSWCRPLKIHFGYPAGAWQLD